MGFGLLCKHTLRFITVTLALAILLVGILDGDLLVHHILTMHVCDSSIGRIEVGKRHKSVTFGHLKLITRHFRSVDERPKAAKCVVECLLVNHGIQISYKEFCANLDVLLLVGRGLIHTNRGSVKTSRVEDGDDVFGVALGREFDETEALVLAVDAVDGHVDCADAAMVVHQLSQELLCDILVNVTDVDGGLLVLLPA